MHRQTFLIASVAVAWSVGCAGAQVSRSGHGGGELSMWGPVMPAAQEGRQALLEHCAGPYQVDERGQSLGLGGGRGTWTDDGQVAARDPEDGSVRVVRFRCRRGLRIARR